ncbi:RNA-binding protein 45-like [Colias croceus]|uniref:RNA-binding protein 45-like n=1 Tax=Colias crocea TaxID=72248 RepID=UPI001E27DEB5|nr:RNA-binding protein 45-like [Colias croceus]
MDNRRKYSRNEERSEDVPVYSRLFVVCDRNLKEETLRDEFSKFGIIDDLRIPLDHNTGEPKGIAFIKYSKTSEAAVALENMHGKTLRSRQLKVMVAANRSDIQTDELDDEKYRRLFLHIAKEMNEDHVKEHFQQYGFVEDVLVQRDRNTGAPRGFAYVKFRKFSEAAIAFEQCDRRYRAIFASPKGQRRPETTFESNINSLVAGNSIMSMMNVRPKGFTRLHFMCSPYLLEMHVARLFNIIPGMINCKLIFDIVRNFSKGFVEYSNPICAQYALEQLNEFEYPPGQRIFVKPATLNFGQHEENSFNLPNTVNKLKDAINSTQNSQTPDLAKLAEAIAEASKIIKMATAGVADDNIPDAGDLNYCSVALPSPQPLADIDSPVAKRCFLICKPQPPPLTVLRDIFCRFGNLINVYTLPNKTVGYARYSTVESADMAIKTLHGAEICGVRIKVIEAEEEVPNKRPRFD